MKEGKYIRRFVHRIVASCYLPPPPDASYQVNHKDGNKLNNKPCNLEWITPEQNIEHAINNKLYKPPNKKKVCQYSLDGVFIKEFPSYAEASRVAGGCISKICECVKGTRKSAGGFIWRSTCV